MNHDDETPPTIREMLAWAVILGIFAGMLFFAFHFNPA